MEDIKQFAQEFFKLEAEASDARLVPNIRDYNNKIEKMKQFCTEDVENTFGMVPLFKT